LEIKYTNISIQFYNIIKLYIKGPYRL